MSTRLSVLPSDILSCITDSLNAYHICKLWFCGDSLLIYKLGNGGVKRFKLLTDEESFPIPLLVSHFKELRQFHLETNSCSSENLSLAPTFDRLSDKVTSLVMSSMDLPTYCSTSGPIWTRMTSLTLLNPKVSSIDTLLKLPSTLTRLELDAFFIDLPAEPLISCLPPSLTSLTLPSIIRPLEGDKKASLAHLVELQVLSIEKARAVDLSSLSSLRHLRRLYLGHLINESTISTLEMVTHLPRHMVELVFSIRTISTALIRALPRTLQILQMAAQPNMDVTLDYLDSFASCHMVTAEMLNELPPNLIELSLGQELSMDYSLAHLLPPSLTFIYLYHTTSDKIPDPSKSPPASILHLEIPSFHVDLKYIILPPKLRFLLCNKITLEDNVELALPSSLTELKTQILISTRDSAGSMHPYSAKPASTSQHYVRETPSKPLKLRFPHSLATLKISYVSPYGAPHLLSSNITQLSLHTGSVGIRARVFDKGWSRYLPKTLESLNLCVLHLLLDETWADQLHTPLLRRIEISLIRDPFDRPTEVSIVQLLMNLQCPVLESVQTSLDRPIDWNNFNMAHFPRLREIFLFGSRSGSYPRDLIERMPPNLRRLTMPAMTSDPPETSDKNQTQQLVEDEYASKRNKHLPLWLDTKCQKLHIKVLCTQ